MAFMVVSAVAFSMFMRQSRLPSSFLRQRLTASQLVKAGLACAMQRLDAGIGDNPYPGVPEVATRSVEFKKKDGTRQRINYGNYWHNRVFLESQLAKDGSIGNDDAGLDYDTVSTLTLEALAYLPPPLVNTVRFWSKRTSTASWASLGYDAGRYAFTAVNVSDYLDVNRLRANAMRDSSPENRISIGYLFENDRHTGPGDVSPADFDAFIGKVTNDVFRTRFVSLADYNLALGSGAYGDVGFESPFWNYLDKGKRPGDGTFYGSFWDLAKRQKFVTDSWFPGLMDGDTGTIYLTDETRGQPFDGLKESLDDLQGNGSDVFKILRERLDICTLGALYDYVDEDDVPISLAIPTAERAPMLTGINLTASGLEVALNAPKVTKVPGAASPKQDDERKTWTAKSLGGDPRIDFSACGVFPFKRTSGVTPPGYKAQVFVALFFSDGAFDDTRLSASDMPYRPKVDSDWTANPKGLASTGKGWITLVGEGNVSFKNGALDENETVFDVTGVRLDVPADAIENAGLYGTFQKYKLNPITGGPQPDGSPVYDPTEMKTPLVYRNGASAKAVGDNLELHLCYACWVRLVCTSGEDSGKTVDLVPAQQADDKAYNGFDSGTLPAYDGISGFKTPLLPFASGPLLKLDLATFNGANAGKQPTGVDQGNLAIYCDDPRYNWAPEDWYVSPNGQVKGSTWLAAAQSRCQGGDRRPHDVFQFVSNAGYLQSMSELQFLPFVTDFKRKGNPFSGAFFNSGKYSGTPFSARKAATDLANRDFAWKTHWCFGDSADRDRDGEDCCPYEWGIEDTNGGVTVNPYADKELLMAALANTPYDWSIASADNGYTLDSDRKFTFGPGSTEARVEWTELEKVAQGIRDLVGTSKDWEERLFESKEAGQKWDDDSGPFGANFGDNFHDVDRKFLYGYWRNCFANTQQLFLVFVRAEPSVMGGSSAGHTPSQLGARAVALVWREPESSISDESSADGNSSHPHRMRILFYHQFE